MSSPLSNVPFAVAVNVGPGDREIERLIDLAASVTAWEPHGPAWFVMVDDGGPTPRDLDRRLTLPAGWKAISLHHPRRPGVGNYKFGKGICSPVLVSLAWIQKNTDARFVLKLDTDSLVIAPFAQRITHRFEDDRDLAMVGAYRTTPNGSSRDWTAHEHGLRTQLHRSPIARLRAAMGQPTERCSRLAPLRAVVTRAKNGTHGYVHGEHCLGGGYALSRPFIDRLAHDGWLRDPLAWQAIDLAEDAMVGIHVRAVDMTFADSVAAGDIFGIRYKGLPFPPAELQAKGYSVIHAVKNDPHVDEATIRAFFAERRQRA